MFDITKKHQEKIEKAIENPQDLHEWKEDLLPRVKEATESDDIREKIDTLAEVCLAFSAQMAYDAAVKTKALVTVMKNRHGLSDEEIDKWLSGNSLIPQISTPKR